VKTNKQKSKLYLQTETIMQLQLVELDHVRGGVATQPPPPTHGTVCPRTSCPDR
jgi:hypothetical protein